MMMMMMMMMMMIMMMKMIMFKIFVVFQNWKKFKISWNEFTYSLEVWKSSLKRIEGMLNCRLYTRDATKFHTVHIDAASKTTK